MSLYTEIELSQLIVAQTISPQLHNHSMWPIFRHNSGGNILEKLKKVIIADSRSKRNIESIVFAIKLSILMNSSSSWKEIISILMK